MNRFKVALFLVVCSAVFFSAASCRKKATGSSNVKIEPELIMFGGWQAANNGIYLAKKDVASEEAEKIYFALAKPNGEPAIDSSAPQMEINIGKNLYLSGANGIGKYAHVTTEKDESDKISKAQVYIAYSKSNMGSPKYFDLEPVPHSLHGWSFNNVHVVMSAEGKKLFLINDRSGGIQEIPLKNITSFNNVVLSSDKKGVYVVGDTALPGFGIEYVNLFQVPYKKEESVSILNVPKTKTEQAAFRGILSPDQKTLALFTNTHRIGSEDDFHADAENKLSLYDVASGQMTREFKLPAGAADPRNLFFVSGPWWRPDNQAIAFDLRPAREQKVFYSIDLPTGEITNWFTSEKHAQ